MRIFFTLLPAIALSLGFASGAQAQQDDNWSPGGGGVVDSQTGLIWSKPANTSATYAYAVKWADGLVEGGYSDWRLPTLDELRGAAAHGLGYRVASAYDDGGIECNWSCWTSTPLNSQYNWRVGLGNGLEEGGHIRNLGISAIAVRGTATPLARTLPGVRVYTMSGPSTWENNNGEATAAFTVALDMEPTHDVIVPVASGDTSEGTVAINWLLFTPQSWSKPQWVIITPADDGVRDGDVIYPILLGQTISEDPAYQGIDPADVWVINRDALTSHFMIYGSTLTTSEPSSGSVNVAISVQRWGGYEDPAASIVLEAVAGTATAGADYTVSTPQTIQFPVGLDLIHVPVAIHADSLADGDETFLIRLSNPSAGGAVMRSQQVVTIKNTTPSTSKKPNK